MGSARVQYELERTLPSLQLAAIHGLFSKDVELRSITQKRRQYENALVRRHALSSDFVQYIQYEEDLEKLRVLRVTRLMDINKIPRADMIKMQKEAIAHIVSIFERGVRRLRYDLDLWKYYIRWTHSRKMRVIQSRVSARALALFSNKVELWLIVANYELNDYQSASTSRALLQRGIRLNSISHPKALSAQAEERPAKRSRKHKAEVPTQQAPPEIVPAGNQDEDTATLVLSDGEKDLVRIWTEYIRMELVFLERLRRRRIVLGISTEELQNDADGDPRDNEGTLDDELASDQVPISNENEAAPTSIKSMKNGVQPNQAAEALMEGAIPKAALRSALSLQSPSSLPPKTHFALLLAISQLLGTFPFCEDTTDLRNSLLSEVNVAIKKRFPADSNALLLASAAEILQSTIYISLSEVESKEELADGTLLRQASRLTNSNLDNLLLKPVTDASQGDEVCKLIFAVIGQSLSKVEQSANLASYIRDLVEAMRKEILVLQQSTQHHFKVQLQLVQFLQGVSRQRGLGDALAPYFKACLKRVAKDSKKMGCEGPSLTAEKFRILLIDIRATEDDAEAKQELLLAEIDISKACHEYHNHSDLLVLYAETLLLCARAEVFPTEQIDSRWQKLLSQKTARESVSVWMLWGDWVLDNNDEKIVRQRLQSSLLQTMHMPAAHEVLLQRYLSQAKSTHEVMKRLTFIEKKAFPQPTLWRWATSHFKQEEESDKNESKDVLDHVYHKLCSSSGSVEDYGSYLAFLMFDSDQQTKAINVFKEAQNRFARQASDKVCLEGIWTTMNKKRRLIQETRTEDKVASDPEA